MSTGNNQTPGKPTPLGMIVTIVIFIGVLVWVITSDNLEINWVGIPVAAVLVIGSVVQYLSEVKRYKRYNRRAGRVERYYTGGYIRARSLNAGAA